MLALTIGLAVFVGVSLGLLGGGGSILTVPLLTYVAGMEPAAAIATSLLVVGVTSAVGAVPHARAGRVRWRTGMAFGGAGVAGAFAGGIVAQYIPGSFLLVGFAVMMIATAIAMLRGRRKVQSASPHEISRVKTLTKTLAVGLAVGLVTGLVGAGGGFLVVPALALLGGLPMPVAVGTALTVISVNSFAGLVGHLSDVHVNWPVAWAITAAAVLGALLGARLSASLDPDVLRRAFGWFVLAISSVVLGQEIHPIVGIAVAALTAGAAVVTFVCTRYTHCPLRRFVGGRLAGRAAA